MNEEKELKNDKTDEKQIKITGQHNRYEIKKLTQPNRGKTNKKTTISQSWNIDPKWFLEDNQLHLLKLISDKEENNKQNNKDDTDETNKKYNADKIDETNKRNKIDENKKYKDDKNKQVCNILINQIKTKIRSYKSQDMKKLDYDENDAKYKQFVTFQDVIFKLSESGVSCRFCQKTVLLLYEKVRENKQWTLDRKDNSVGHITSNVEIVCLGCNLKRRKQSESKFFFTKQLKISKLD